MPDFTPAEIDDARRNPRAGDRWEKAGSSREVTRFMTAFPPDIQYTQTVRGRVYKANYVYLAHWGRWTRNATLLKRGDA